MESSDFSRNQNIIDIAEPLNVGGATSDCFKVKLYGKMHFLKRLKPELRNDPRYVAALQKEFETGYNLDHPHLVRYLACGDGYLLTEFVDGTTLGEFAENNPAFFNSRDNVNRLLSSLIDVIGYLHAHQIIHLDLKPDNILITHVGNEMKLTDLGFCYTDTFTDTMGRTDNFAAPEQLDDNGKVDHRTDIYAVGRIISTLPCAAQYRKVIERCTKYSKDDRYQSAAQIKKDLGNKISKPKLLAAVAAVVAIVAVTSVWGLRTKQNANTTNITEESITPDTTSTIATDHATTDSVEQSKPDPDQEINKTEQTAIDQEEIRNALIAATQPIYNKFLKRYENDTTFNRYDFDFNEAMGFCRHEMGETILKLYETKFKPMGVTEQVYDPIALDVVDHHISKFDRILYGEERKNKKEYQY